MEKFNFNAWLADGHATLQRVEANTSLFCLGDECSHYVVVKQGTVRVELLSTSGQQMLLYKIDRGQSCVMTTSCLFSNSKYFAQAMSETAAELILVPQTVFQRKIDESADFRAFVFEGFHQRLAGLLSRTAELATRSIDQRLAAALVSHVDALGTNQPITLTHEQLAIEIGSAREVISRRLASLEKRGFVERHRGSINVVDVKKLSQLLANK